MNAQSDNTVEQSPPSARLITAEQRQLHLDWLTTITQIPTAAGKEHRVINWINAWVADRPDLESMTDASGNITIRLRNAPRTDTPLYFTAHLDHPAFVISRIVSPTVLELAFRGGVMDDYFNNAAITLIDQHGARFAATILEKTEGPSPKFKYFLCELANETDTLSPGDIGMWDFPPASIKTTDGVECLHTNACDDLAALAAALSALDLYRQHCAKADTPSADVRLLLTRAEEVGFIGAIGACKHHTIEPGARLIALENSRAFDDSPIGAGPIVRVGDRISIFTPALTAAIASVAEKLSGGPAQPTASQKLADMPTWRWQRKLMAGGACEASVFCAFGLCATCVCLPLGNYHNMADLAAVQASTNTTPPHVGQEYIAISDYHALIDLLLACAVQLGSVDALTQSSFMTRIESLWKDLSSILSDE